MTSLLQPQPKSKTPQRSGLIVIVIVVVAVVAAAALILLSFNQPVTTALEDLADVPKVRLEDGGFVLGYKDAPVTIVEFADFTCPHCQDYVPTIDQFIDEYVITGKAKFEYRMLRSTSHPLGNFLAQLVECADDVKPGSFWAAHSRIYQLSSAGQYENIGPAVANYLDIPYGDLLACTTEADQFVFDGALAADNGVQGTPAIMVRYNDGPLQWPSGASRGGLPFSVLAGIVDSAS
jgi:protein-disulfide isomerase